MTKNPAAVCAALIAIPLSVISVGAAKPVANPTCGVLLADQSADAVRSDGRGPYLHGTDSVECQVWIGGTGDLTLRLPPKTTTRRFSVDYTSLAGGAQSPNPPIGVTAGGWFLNIRGIGSMAVGATQLVQATVQADGDNAIFRFCGGGTGSCSFGGTDPGSSLVMVTRHSLGWSVTTEVESDLATLYRPFRGSYQPVALYHLPFALEVSCPTCPTP